MPNFLKATLPANHNRRSPPPDLIGRSTTIPPSDLHQIMFPSFHNNFHHFLHYSHCFHCYAAISLAPHSIHLHSRMDLLTCLCVCAGLQMMKTIATHSHYRSDTKHREGYFQEPDIAEKCLGRFLNEIFHQRTSV